MLREAVGSVHSRLAVTPSNPSIADVVDYELGIGEERGSGEVGILHEQRLRGASVALRKLGVTVRIANSSEQLVPGVSIVVLVVGGGGVRTVAVVKLPSSLECHRWPGGPLARQLRPCARPCDRLPRARPCACICSIHRVATLSTCACEAWGGCQP